MQINNELRSKNSFMCWFPWLLWTNKPIHTKFTKHDKTLQGTWTPRHLRLYFSVSLTSHIVNQCKQQPRLWIKRKLQCKLFLVNHYPLRHPVLILCWAICSYQQQRIPLWVAPFLLFCENSEDNEESLLPCIEKIPQGPMLLLLLSVWEKI